MKYLKDTPQRKIKFYDLTQEKLPDSDLIKMIFISKDAYKGTEGDFLYRSKSLEDVERKLYKYPTRVILGLTFYIVYSVEPNSIYIDSMAMSDKDKVDITRNIELYKALKMVLAESINSNGEAFKDIIIDMVGKDSYRWVLCALFKKRNSLIEENSAINLFWKSNERVLDYTVMKMQKRLGKGRASGYFIGDLIGTPKSHHMEFRMTNYGINKLGLTRVKKL